LIYDGDRGNREWWQERFGEEPAILCPKCDKREWVGLTEDEMSDAIYVDATPMERGRRVEAAVKDKNA